MTDPRRPDAPFSSDALPADRPKYRIMRKGSRYNILGPHGRVFTKYRSASTAGPRWEELTHTPWPYASSAYTRGRRLWELGLIDRQQVGAQEINIRPGSGARPASQPEQSESPVARVPPEPPAIVVPLACFALPAPSLDRESHERMLRALQRDPALLFTPEAQHALRNEVLYHRPQARWAQHLLNLLARYERQQRRQRPAPVDPETVLQKHIAWQEHRINMAAIASLSC